MKKILAVLLAALMLFSLAACGGNTDDTNKDGDNELITNIVTGTGGNTGTYYAFTTAVGTLLGTDDYKFTVQSTGGSQANIEMIEDGEAQFAIVQNDVMNYAYEGTNGFTAPVTCFSAIGCVYAEVCQVIATKSSGIKTIADLKGKNVAVGDAGSGVYYNATQILAAAGLDINTDINATAASFGDSATLLKDGAIDAAFITAGTPTPAVSDLATSTDIVAVDLGEDVINKLMADYPFYAKHEYTSDDYDFITDGEATTVAIMATFIATNDMSEDQAYEITKNLWEKQEEIATAHAKGKEMSKDAAAAAIGKVPLHPGAAKYYKEIGVIA
ncbi:MAG: TAXI family TRAP transporter solute-binding subunit [Clostridia bacterium]|nr:TAXI family TRAP transporter solute-binding subunit [Clostridia bacterium]